MPVVAPFASSSKESKIATIAPKGAPLASADLAIVSFAALSVIRIGSTMAAQTFSSQGMEPWYLGKKEVIVITMIAAGPDPRCQVGQDRVHSPGLSQHGNGRCRR